MTTTKVTSKEKGATSVSEQGDCNPSLPNATVPADDALPTRISTFFLELSSDIQDLPDSDPGPLGLRRTNLTNSRPLNLQYDNQGRVLKNSIQGRSGLVGAFAVTGLGTMERRPSCNTTLVGSSDHTTEDVENQSRELQATQSNSQQTDEHDKASSLWWRRKSVIVTGVAIMVLVGTAAIAIPLLIITSSPAPDPIDMVQDNSSAPEQLGSLVPNLPSYTLLALQNDSSPQSQAYEWVSKDPLWDSFEDWRKLQRFALACIFFSVGAQEAFLGYTSYSSPECTWQTIFKMCPGDDGIIKALGSYVQWGVSFRGWDFPPEVALLSHLEVLDFENIKFLPPLPSIPLELWPSLTSVRIVGSKLEGTIPSTIGLLTSLTLLDLSENLLDSTIPSELGLLSNLTTLVLSSNELTGSIPEEVARLSSLEVFKVDENSGLDATTLAANFSQSRYTSVVCQHC